MARSRQQLAAIFAALKGKSPLARAKTLRKKGFAAFQHFSNMTGKRLVATWSGKGRGGSERTLTSALGLKRKFGPGGKGYAGRTGWYR